MSSAKIADSTPAETETVADASVEADRALSLTSVEDDGEPNDPSMAAPTIADSTLEEHRALILVSIEGENAARTAAQELLMKLYYDKLLRFFRYRAGPDDFNDLQHDVWTIVLDKDRIDKIKAINTSVRSYIYRIAKNVLYTYYRKRKRTFDPVTSSLEVFDVTLSRLFAQKHDAATLQKALPKLPVDDQVLLELRYFEKLSTRELAAVYDVPVGTIKSRLHTARKALDEQMQPKGP